MSDILSEISAFFCIIDVITLLRLSYNIFHCLSNSMSARVMIMRYISKLLFPFSHAIFRTSLCALSMHIESRFCNPHILILLN
jgi:hypothetical protein